MPRARKVQAPGPRADGEMTPGNAAPIGAGQPNGRPPRSAITQAAASAGAGGPMRYGEGGSLAADASQMPPPPPGVTPEAHAAHLAGQQYRPNVTPLFSPSSNTAEPVTAGAPLDAGPTNPMATAGMNIIGGSNAVAVLSQAAAASGSPTLAALAQRAQSMMGSSEAGQP